MAVVILGLVSSNLVEHGRGSLCLLSVRRKNRGSRMTQDFTEPGSPEVCRLGRPATACGSPICTAFGADLHEAEDLVQLPKPLKLKHLQRRPDGGGNTCVREQVRNATIRRCNLPGAVASRR